MNDNAQEYYATRYPELACRDDVWKKIANFLSPRLRIQEHSVVVELGVGYGSWIRSVESHERHALDLNSALPELLKSRGILNVTPHVGNCTDLTVFQSTWADTMLASNLLEHLDLPEIQMCLAECHRVLKPGGTLCIIQPNFALCPRSYFDDYTHKTILTDVSLSDLLIAKKFQIERLWRRFLPFSMKSSSWAARPFFVPIYLRSPYKPFAGQMAIIARKVV